MNKQPHPRHDKNATIALITHDYINTGPDDKSAVGTAWSRLSIETSRDRMGFQPFDYEGATIDEEFTRFRLYDDDKELYYTGWLYDDDMAVTQQAVLAWGTFDSGCTTIEVKRDGKWVQDIG